MAAPRGLKLAAAGAAGEGSDTDRESFAEDRSSASSTSRGTVDTRCDETRHRETRCTETKCTSRTPLRKSKHGLRGRGAVAADPDVHTTPT